MEERMETPQPVNQAPVKKNQTLLIIAAVAIVLFCCCIAVVVAGYYNFITIRSTETEVQPIQDTAPDSQLPGTDSSPDEDYEVPDSNPGVAPTGGLGNDILRNDTWQYVSAAAVGLGCDKPLGPDSTIEVLQEPTDSVWMEKWTVACASGDNYPFEVEFVLDDTGATFNIKSLP